MNTLSLYQNVKNHEQITLMQFNTPEEEAKFKLGNRFKRECNKYTFIAVDAAKTHYLDIIEKFGHVMTDDSPVQFKMTPKQIQALRKYLVTLEANQAREMPLPKCKTAFHKMLVSQYYGMMNRGEIDFDNRYQRDIVWTEKHQSDLINSLYHGMIGVSMSLNNIAEEKRVNPVTGNLFLYESIDGKQRSESIRNFVEGRITLPDFDTGAEFYYVRTPENGKEEGIYFLSESRRQLFDETRIAVMIGEYTPELCQTQFNRMQRGVKLTEGEIMYGNELPAYHLARQLVNEFEDRLDTWANKKQRVNFRFCLSLVHYVKKNVFSAGDADVQSLDTITVTPHDRVYISELMVRAIDITRLRGEKYIKLEKRTGLIAALMTIHKSCVGASDDEIIMRINAAIAYSEKYCRGGIRAATNSVYSALNRYLEESAFE